MAMRTRKYEKFPHSKTIYGYWREGETWNVHACDGETNFITQTFWSGTRLSVKWLTTGRAGVPFPVGKGIFLFATTFRRTLEPTHLLFRWTRGLVLSPGWDGWSMELTHIHYHVIPRLRLLHSLIHIHVLLLRQMISCRQLFRPQFYMQFLFPVVHYMLRPSNPRWFDHPKSMW
jgi:hypothetical protein